MANEKQQVESARELRTPDPSPLTTQQLWREITSLKELLFTRLDGMDKAIELFNDNITRVPTDTDKQISHLKELVFERFEVDDEKFSGIEKQFSERDTRGETQQRDGKVAVDAALQAQKESVNAQNISNAQAIAKSEANFVKLIDGLGVLINTSNKAMDDKIDDIKERLGTIEGKGMGVGMVGAMVVGVAVIIAAVVGFMTFLGTQHTPIAVAPASALAPQVVVVPAIPNGTAAK